MILSGQSIRSRCVDLEYRPKEEGKGWNNSSNVPVLNPDAMIEPFMERSVSPSGMSFGLSVAGYDIRVDKFDRTDFRSVRMQNGDFVLASSVERIRMPNDLICFVKDKSSWARRGLAVQNTVLEPGWEGFITLELSFHRPAHHIVINQGDPIAQLIFQRLDEPAEKPYSGKYQNQPNKPIEAIKEEGGLNE